MPVKIAKNDANGGSTLNVLIVGQYYYPDNFKINEISFELVKQGHQLTILTGLPDYSTGRVPKEYRLLRNRKQVIQGVRVVRVPIIARRTGVIWRFLNYFSYKLMSSIYSSFFKKDFDIIFCYQTSPITMAHAAVKLKKRANKGLMLYCLDLWPESLKAWDIKETSLLFRIMKKYSSNIYKKCDLIAVSSIPFKDYLVKECKVQASRIVYLPQHAEFPNKITKNETSESINFAFAGNIGKMQDVECIIRAASHLKDLHGFAVHIYGNGSRLHDCMALTEQLGVQGKVIFHGRVERPDLYKKYNNIDAFLLTLRDTGFIGMTVPAKLQEYMAAGKPIIAAINGFAADIINEARCGLICEASDDEQLAINMKEYIINKNAYRDFGNNGYQYYKKNFTLNIFMERLEKILESLIEEIKCTK